MEKNKDYIENLVPVFGIDELIMESSALLYYVSWVSMEGVG